MDSRLYYSNRLTEVFTKSSHTQSSHTASKFNWWPYILSKLQYAYCPYKQNHSSTHIHLFHVTNWRLALKHYVLSTVFNWKIACLSRINIYHKMVLPSTTVIFKFKHTFKGEQENSSLEQWFISATVHWIMQWSMVVAKYKMNW